MPLSTEKKKMAVESEVYFNFIRVTRYPHSRVVIHENVEFDWDWRHESFWFLQKTIKGEPNASPSSDDIKKPLEKEEEANLFQSKVFPDIRQLMSP